eukprot:g4195.t1
MRYVAPTPRNSASYGFEPESRKSLGRRNHVSTSAGGASNTSSLLNTSRRSLGASHASSNNSCSHSKSQLGLSFLSQVSRKSALEQLSRKSLGAASSRGSSSQTLRPEPYRNNPDVLFGQSLRLPERKSENAGSNYPSGTRTSRTSTSHHYVEPGKTIPRSNVAPSLSDPAYNDVKPRFDTISTKVLTLEEWEQQVANELKGGTLPSKRSLGKTYNNYLFFHHNSNADKAGGPPRLWDTVHFHLQEEFVRKHNCMKPSCVDVVRVSSGGAPSQETRDWMFEVIGELKDEFEIRLARMADDLNASTTRLTMQHDSLSERVEKVESAQTRIDQNVQRLVDNPAPSLDQISAMFRSADFIAAFNAAGAKTQEESSAPSSEYNFEVEQPNRRRDRSVRAPRTRQRRKTFRINLLGYNGGGVGESEVFQARNRLIGGEHHSILGPAPSIDAALGAEVFYPSKTSLSDTYGKGHANRQASANKTAYEVLWVRGAAITIYNKHWVEAIRAGKCEVWGSGRIIALRLPRVSLLAAYAPALSGNQNDNDADWYLFQQRLAAALDWGRHVTKSEGSIFRAGNRPIYEYTDNVGCIGDPDSRLRRGYAGATTGKYGMPETSTRGLYALLLHDQVRMVCANSLHPQPVGVCPWGGNYPAGRATHFSRLQKRWRELDVWWCSANATDKVQNVTTVDFGLGTDHLQKLTTVDVELQWQQENSTRRAERDAAAESNNSAKPPPWKPLWRASPEAKFEFSRHVENAIRDSLATPDHEPLLTEVPYCLRYFRPILENSCDERLEAYNRSHDVTRRQKLLDDWAWTRWQMRKWPAGSPEHKEPQQRNERAFHKLREFDLTQRSDFNVDEHCNKQRQLKRQKKARAHEFEPEEAAAHFQRVADNPVLPRTYIIREVVSPLPAEEIEFLCAPFTGAELHAAVHASKKISRQSDAFGDDAQLCRALDVDAWNSIADLINPSWLNGFEGMSEGLQAELLSAVVMLHFKKGDPKLLDNYRGVVNKTIFSKALTAALARRFESVLERNGLYSPSQLGFRSGVQGVELISVVRRMAEDIRLLFGANSEVSRLVTLLEMDIQKAYPSFPFSVFKEILVAMGLGGSNYLQAVELLHLGTRYQVLTAKGLSQVYTLSSGFGEGDRRSPSDFAWSYEICIQLFRRIISTADPASRTGIRLYAPRARLAVEQRRDILRRAHPRSTDLVCIECRDVEYADDTSFPGSLAASLTQCASWQQQGSMTGVRDNPKKTDLALLDEPNATAASRFLGNWLDLEEDTNRRCAKMAFGLHEMSCISGAAASATELRVNVVARVRSRGTFGCETRALFGAFAAPDIDGYLRRHWLALNRQGREKTTLWSQVLQSIRTVAPHVDDKLLVTLAEDREAWRRITTELRIKLIVQDYETDPDTTKDELAAARLYWLDHFQSAGPKAGFSSFNDWCHASPSRGPTFSACDTGERLSKRHEEVCAHSKTTRSSSTNMQPRA